MATDFIDLIVSDLSAAGYTVTGGGLTDGKTVPDRLVGVAPATSVDPEHHVGDGEPAIKRPQVQILVRDDHDSKSRAWSDALEIHDHLDERDLGGAPVKYLEAVEGSPFLLEAGDENGRPVYSMNFEFLIVE